MAVLAALVATACQTTTQERRESAAERAAREQNYLKELQARVNNDVVSEQDLDTAFLFAEELLNSNRVDEAAQLLEIVFRERPSLPVGLKLAALDMVRNDPAKAENLLARLVLFFPNDPLPRMSLSQLYRQQHRTADAIRVLQEAYDHDPKNEEVALALWETMNEGNRTEDAKKLLQELVKRFPSSPVFLVKMAAQLAGEEKPKDAEKLLNKALLAAPENLEARVMAGYIALRDGRYEVAEKHFAWANSLMPEDDRIVGYYVQTLVEQERYEEAARVLGQLESSLAPGEKMQPDLLLQYGNVLYYLERFSEAREKFLANPEALQDAGAGYYLAGMTSERLEDYTAAISNYRNVPAQSSFFRRAEQRLISAKIAIGDFSEARKMLEDFKLTEEDEEEVYLFAIESWGHLKEYSKALEVADRAARLHQNSKAIEFARIPWIDASRPRAETITTLEAFLRKHPNDPSALNYLGYTLAEMGTRLDEAIHLLEKATSLEPDRGFFLDSLGWAHFKKGNEDKARKTLEKAHELEPQEPIILEHLGELAMHQKRLREALDWFRKAESIFLRAPRGRLQSDREWHDSFERVRARIDAIRKQALPFDTASTREHHP